MAEEQLDKFVESANDLMDAVLRFLRAAEADHRRIDRLEKELATLKAWRQGVPELQVQT